LGGWGRWRSRDGREQAIGLVLSLALKLVNLVLEPPEGEVEAHVGLVVPIKLVLNVLIREIPIATAVLLANFSGKTVLSQELLQLIIEL